MIKVEPPGEGDPTRHLGLSDGGSTVYFRNLNRGKKSVVMDLKKPEEREALLKLCESADVFVESFRPGVVERLGVSYEQVSARNPRIVYCSISAFGQQGPLRDRPAHDLAVESLSGVISLNLGQDGKPTIPALPVADLLCALQGLSGILMALLRREQTGKGDYLDMAMYDATLAGSANILGPTLAENRQPVARHERTTGGSAFYRLYETADGRYLALGGQEMKFVRNLLGALGRLGACLSMRETRATSATGDAFSRGCVPGQVPSGKSRISFETRRLLRTGAHAAGSARRGRRQVAPDEHGRRHLAPPIRFRHEPARPNLREPKLGEHDALKKTANLRIVGLKKGGSS